MAITDAAVTVGGTRLLSAPVVLATAADSGSRMPVLRFSFTEWLGLKAGNGAAPTVDQQWTRIAGGAPLELASRYVVQQSGAGTVGGRVAEASLVGFAASFRTSLRALVAQFIKDCVGAQIAAQQEGGTSMAGLTPKLNTSIDDNLMPPAVRDLRTMVPGAITAAVKANVIDQINRWCNDLQTTMWREWMTKEGRRAPAGVEKQGRLAAVARGTACAVWVVRADGTAAQVGGQYSAALGTGQPGHAEMQWKGAHTAALDAEINAGATRVEFHISRVPCDDGYTCARSLIEWWRARPGADTWGYIFTDADDYPARRNVYLLTSDAVVKTGTW